MKLSVHFSLEEFIASQTATRLGILNYPDEKELAALHTTAQGMETVRALLKHPINISSGFRNRRLNTAVGGGSNSQHIRGQACDFTCKMYGTPFEVARAIAASGIMFDQLIYEGTWVHISFVEDNPRRDVLTAKFFPDAPTRYEKGIVA